MAINITSGRIYTVQHSVYATCPETVAVGMTAITALEGRGEPVAPPAGVFVTRLQGASREPAHPLMSARLRDVRVQGTAR